MVRNSMNSIYKLEDIGTMHCVYLGAPGVGQIDSEYEQAAMDECSVLFKSFCVTRATGMFHGKTEETLVFHLSLIHI